MKLKELQQIFLESTDLTKLEYDNIPSVKGQGSQIVFKNLTIFRNAILIFEKANLFQKEITEFKESVLFATSNDHVNILSNEAKILIQKVNNFDLLFTSFLSTLNELVGKTKENVVSIKFPKINDLDGLAKAASNFNKIFSQIIINDEIKGKIKIENVENGSIWLDIFVGTSSAMTLIGSLVWSSVVIYKKIQEARIFEEHVKSLKIKNDSLSDMRDAQKKALDLMIDTEAKFIYKENFKEDNNEQMERLKNSIKLLSEQIDRGAEIHPALNTPEEVKNLFPNITNLPQIESRVKKITG